MTKHEKILNHLQRYGSITGKISWMKYGLYRLSSVINRLRKSGLEIKTEMQIKNGETFAKYVLVK